MEYQQVLEGEKQAQKDNLADLAGRFRQSRTAIANLDRAVQRLTATNRQTLRIKAASQPLENDAISLSPLLGRCLYIEQKLQQNQLTEARRSLDKLDRHLQALTAKAGELEQKLHQQIFMHGEKDQDIIIKNDRREHIRHDCHLKVDNDRVEEVGQDSSSKVDRDRNEATGRKHSITVGEEQTVQVGDHYHLESGKTQYFHAGKHIVLESDEELTIQSSGGFIKIDSGGITIQGKVVNINSGGSPSIGHPVQANIARAATLATGGSTREAKASEAPQPEPMAMPEPKAPAIASLPGSSQAEALRQAAKAGESRCPVCDKK
jgi:hypothetical protein